MENNEDYNRRFLTFDTSLIHLHKARALLSEKLGINYRYLVDAANDPTKQLLVFIDLEAATDDDGSIACHRYQSAGLYKDHGGGKIFALTTHFETSSFIIQYGVFTRVLTAMVHSSNKARHIVHIFNHENAICESKIIVMGSPELLAAVTPLLPPNRRGDILVDITVHCDTLEEPENYSLDDYIFYYLTMCRISQLMKEESRDAGGKCSCLAKFLHPKELISQHYPNADKTLRLKDLNIVHQEVKHVHGKKSTIVWVEHILPSGEIIELQANLKWIVLA